MLKNVSQSARYARETGIADMSTLCRERTAAFLGLMMNVLFSQTASVITNHVGYPPFGITAERTHSQPCLHGTRFPLKGLILSGFSKPERGNYSTCN
jgi:hypothetical protein